MIAEMRAVKIDTMYHLSTESFDSQGQSSLQIF